MLLVFGGAISCDNQSNVAGDTQNSFSCTVDEDCQMAFGEQCIDGFCIVPVTGNDCLSDEDCGYGSHCNLTSGMCEQDENLPGDTDKTENTGCASGVTCQETIDCIANELPDHECIDGCCVEEDDPFEKLCAVCSSVSDCNNASALCLPDPEEGTYCALPCETHGQCPDDYLCQPIQGSMYCRPSDGYCGTAPAGCRVTGCPDGQYCNTQTNRCEDVPAGGLGYCEPCTTDADCGGAEDLCIPDSTGSTFCGVDCSGDQPCTMTNSYCMRVSEDGSQKQCFPFSRTCPTTNGDCRQTGVCEEGMVCEEASGQCVPADCRTNTVCSEDTTCDQSTGYCVPEDCRNGAACPTGTSCNASTGECVPNDCREPGGWCPEGTYCSTTTGLCVVGDDEGCQSDNDCPLGYVCNPYTGLCEVDSSSTDCRDDPSICPDGYECNQATGTCDYDWGCTSDDDCPTGQVCDWYSGECVTGTSRCTSDDDCQPGEACDWSEGTCVWQQCTVCRSFYDCEGFFDCVDGYCLDDCYSNTDCPSGYTCQTVDWDSYCLPSSGSCDGSTPSTWCPDYNGFDSCCKTDDPCSMAGNDSCDCMGACSWDDADCSGNTEECSGSCSSLQDNTCMEDGVSLCFCGDDNRLTVVDCESGCLNAGYNYFHHCGYHSETGYEVCQCSDESGGDTDPTECSGYCYGDDQYCMEDDLTLCLCDSETDQYTQWNCAQYCQENGYAEGTACGYSSSAQEDTCLCTCGEGGLASCEEPLIIDSFPYAVEGQTLCLDNELQVSGCSQEGQLAPQSSSGPELVFRFTARSGYKYRFDVYPTGWDAMIVIYDSTGCSQTSGSCWHYDDNRSTDNETALFEPSAAGTYFVAVQYYDTQGGENDYLFTAVEIQADADVCNGYTGSSPCCYSDDPCGWSDDDECDCNGACDWDDADCSGSSGQLCPGHTAYEECCYTDDPCDYADDDYCDCSGCDWDQNDCGGSGTCSGSCSYDDDDYCLDDSTVCSCDIYEGVWTVTDCVQYCSTGGSGSCQLIGSYAYCSCY